MKVLDMVAWILLIVGGLNWGLVGLLDLNLVDAIFGAGTTLARLVYDLVGLSAIWAIFRFKKCCSESCHK